MFYFKTFVSNIQNPSDKVFVSNKSQPNFNFKLCSIHYSDVVAKVIDKFGHFRYKMH